MGISISIINRIKNGPWLGESNGTLLGWRRNEWRMPIFGSLSKLGIVPRIHVGYTCTIQNWRYGRRVKSLHSIALFPITSFVRWSTLWISTQELWTLTVTTVLFIQIHLHKVKDNIVVVVRVAAPYLLTQMIRSQTILQQHISKDPNRNTVSFPPLALSPFHRIQQSVDRLAIVKQ